MNQVLGEAVVILSEFIAVLLPAILATGMIVGAVAVLALLGEWAYEKIWGWRK